MLAGGVMGEEMLIQREKERELLINKDYWNGTKEWKGEMSPCQIDISIVSQ